jgi:hypothetical protein
MQRYEYLYSGLQLDLQATASLTRHIKKMQEPLHLSLQKLQ